MHTQTEVQEYAKAKGISYMEAKKELFKPKKKSTPKVEETTEE